MEFIERKKQFAVLKNRFSNLSEFNQVKIKQKAKHHFCLLKRCDMLLCGMGNEDNAHFLHHCHWFHVMRRDLLGQLSEIPGLDLTNMDSKALCELLLYGSPQLTLTDIRLILEATMSFIDRFMRMD